MHERHQGMDLATFKAAATSRRHQLSSPVTSLEVLQDIANLLRDAKHLAADVDYLHLCDLFLERLREQVNPYRHRTHLDDYREPAQLRLIEPWLHFWTETLATLPCAAARIPDWHRTYDVALTRVLTALLKQRLGFAADAGTAWTEAATICRSWLDQNRDREQSEC